MEPSAEDILSQIPDADLPEAEDTKGKPFEYFQNKQEQHAQHMPTPSGEPVELASAKPNCLLGLTIIFTGVLPRLERTEAENLAKRYGAKVTKSILGKTSLVVIGEEAGPSKIEKIKKNKIKAVDEEGFIQLLNKMPENGGSGKNAVNAVRKREEEEHKIEEEAEAQEKQEREQEKENRDAKPINRQTDTQRAKTSNDDVLWTLKYSPSDISQLCGNKGQVQKLKTWLSNWFENAKTGFQNPGTDGSGIFRACLVSGPPGIGKTTAAHLVARSLGFDILEKNASDVRSKLLLNSNIKNTLSNTSVVGFFKNQGHEEENNQRFCLIMDEVDGMSSGDHGGAGALSAFCRITNMPMILICNDKSLPKMRTFDRVTFDIPFRRPTETEVRARLMTIAHREKLKLDPTIIGQLVQATNNDIRQMINLMATVSRTQNNIGHKESKDLSRSWQKQIILKPFDITGRLLSGATFSSNSDYSLNDKIDLYFNDIDFTPLMIQENYIFTRPTNVKSQTEHLERVVRASEDISISDRINSLIRSSEQQWSLLPFHAIMSSVKPALEVAGSMSQRINFTSWLGQNSKSLKYQRLLQEILYHANLKTRVNSDQMRLFYVALFVHKLTEPMLMNGEDGIDEVINFMDHYYLTREDWDSLLDFGVGPAKGEFLSKKIPTKVKTAFSRKYNTTTHPVAIYKPASSVGVSAQKPQKVDFEDVIDDDVNVKDESDSEENPNDALDTRKDKLVKEVKPKKTSSTPKKTSSTPKKTSSTTKNKSSRKK